MLTVHVKHHGSSQESLPTSGRTALEANDTPTAPIFLTSIQVAVHKAHEQPSTPQANHFGTDITGKQHGKQQDLIVDIVNDHDRGQGRKMSLMTQTAE